MNKKSGKLIITSYNYDKFHKKGDKKSVACFIADNKLEYIKVIPDEDTLPTGTIVTGKVTNIVQNIPAAFISLNNKKDMGFLSLADLQYAVVTNRKFQGKLQAGDEVLVKIVREPMKTKDYTVSAVIDRTGKYAAARMGNGTLLFSKKLTSKDKTVILNYLVSKGIATRDKKLVGIERFDITIRTEAENLVLDSHLDILVKDMENTTSSLDRLISEASMRTCHTVHEKPHGWFGEMWKEVAACGYHIDEYVTDQFQILDMLQEIVPAQQQNHIRYYQDEKLSLSALYGLKEKIDELLQVKVWLPSGGYLCIEHTEALTVVDVNTGKAIYKGKDSDTLFLEINKEAAAETLRQLRLRNISGMIVIDFINMRSKEQEDEILNYLKGFSCDDYSKVYVYDFTRLGLVELTRAKISKALHEIM